MTGLLGQAGHLDLLDIHEQVSESGHRCRTYGQTDGAIPMMAGVGFIQLVSAALTVCTSIEQGAG